VGVGVLSQASATVIARAGADPGQTTASGGALRTGMAGVVYEQQVITMDKNAGKLVLKPSAGSAYSTGNLEDKTAEEFEAALEHVDMGLGDVHVTRSSNFTKGTDYSGTYTTTWTVTFLDYRGDVPPLYIDSSQVSGTDGTGGASVAEFLKGRANEFTVEPKKASGNVVKDITAEPSATQGEDLFYTELWMPGYDSASDELPVWYADGGVAKYNPVQYSVQKVLITAASSSFVLTMDTSSRLGGVSRATSGSAPACVVPVGGPTSYCSTSLTSDSTALEVKNKLEGLSNVGEVDVLRTAISATETQYLVTFMHDLGTVPALGLTGTGSVGIEQDGVTEVQHVELTSDEEFVQEIQSGLFASGACTALCGARVAGLAHLQS